MYALLLLQQQCRDVNKKCEFQASDFIFRQLSKREWLRKEKPEETSSKIYLLLERRHDWSEPSLILSVFSEERCEVRRASVCTSSPVTYKKKCTPYVASRRLLCFFVFSTLERR